MKQTRPVAAASSGRAAVSAASASAAEPVPALTEKEKEAQRLEEQQRVNTAIVAQWHAKKYRPPPSLSSPSSSSSSASSSSPSLHPFASPLRFKTGFRNTILSTFVERGWQETVHEVDWDVHWTSKEWTKHILPKVHLHPQQLINHFRNYYELTRKDLLIKNLKRRRLQLTREARLTEAADFSFWPETFNLPSEYLLFVETFKRGMAATQPTAGGGGGGISNSWIMKPIGSSQGKGIFLIDKLHQIADWSSTIAAAASPSSSTAASSSSSSFPSSAAASGDDADAAVERYIVQRYISTPLLIGGKKFDLRVYVLVSSYHPLTCYLHRSGFARFSSARYRTSRTELGNSFVHLTNVAIQKHGDDYDRQSGGKWDVAGLRSYLASLHPSPDCPFSSPAIDGLFAGISSLVVNSLLSVSSLMIADPHCFELYGYDVLIDCELRPWLIEVNASPSLSANTAQDEAMKKEMLHDVFHVLEMERWRRERRKRRQAMAAGATAAAGGEAKPARTVAKAEATEAGAAAADDDRCERVGDFDLLYDEKGLRRDREGRPLSCLGLHGDRERELQLLWRRMRRLDEKDRERETKQAQELQQRRDKQRDRRRDKFDRT